MYGAVIVASSQKLRNDPLIKAGFGFSKQLHRARRLTTTEDCLHATNRVLDRGGVMLTSPASMGLGRVIGLCFVHDAPQPPSNPISIQRRCTMQISLGVPLQHYWKSLDSHSDLFLRLHGAVRHLASYNVARKNSTHKGFLFTY